MCVPYVPGAYGGRKKASDLSELELCMVWINMWVLGTKHKSFEEERVLLAYELSLRPTNGIVKQHSST